LTCLRRRLELLSAATLPPLCETFGLDLNRNEPLKAIEALQPATPYELGIMGRVLDCIPFMCVRGEAHLAAREGSIAPQASSRKSWTIAALG
jgi:hypothetical protein